MDTFMEFLTQIIIEQPLAIPVAFLIIVWITERFGIPIAKYFKKSQDNLVGITQTAQQTHAEDAARNDSISQGFISILSDFGGIMTGSLAALKEVVLDIQSETKQTNRQLNDMAVKLDNVNKRLNLMMKYMRYKQYPDMEKMIDYLVAISETTEELKKACNDKDEESDDESEDKIIPIVKDKAA